MSKIVEVDNFTRGLLLLFIICGLMLTVTGAPIGYDDPKDICIQFGGEWNDEEGCFTKGSCGSSILNPGEFAVYFVTIDDGNGLKTKDWFSLEIKPRNGASILISRTITSGVTNGDML